MKCPKCNYEWKARTAQPKKCPACQTWINKPQAAKLILALLALALFTSACTATRPQKLFEDDRVVIYRVCDENPGNWTHTCRSQVIRKEQTINFKSESEK